MLKWSYQTELLEAGCDEAGRGCLAGPVVAAAVILNPENPIEGLDDSKKITETKRELLRPEVEAKALAWAVGLVTNEEIDQINILKGSFMAMHRALDQLKPKAKFIIVDGNRFIPYKRVLHQCIVKGDGKYQNIAAASILAKTHRDEIMRKLHDQYPHFGWERNKGYPTKQHRMALREHGATEWHRMSFRLLQPELELTWPSKISKT
ncbi:MAG: ribonuclease HII [Flavobacteriales bacterium]|jgi:ribonuclease HII|nr:ribonuclease HII [Flavobacteriales bacterium]